MPEDDTRRKLMNVAAPSRLLTRLGWRNETVGPSRGIEVPRETERTWIPPWYACGVKIEEVVLPGKKSDISKETLFEITKAKIDSIEADIHIYTDGSTDGTQHNGGAGVHIMEPTLGAMIQELRSPAGKWCSSYGGEAVAMLEAAKWINTQADPSEKHLILTDSRSLLDAIRSNNWKDDDPWLSRIKVEFNKSQVDTTILWIPSHCGTEGNERADSLANEATKLDQSATIVTRKIVKAKIKNTSWKITHPRAKAIFGRRRGPRRNIEKNWSRRARSMFARLRTDHAKELKEFRYRILKTEETPDCDLCGLEAETSMHILSRCPAHAKIRREEFPDGVVTRDMIVQKPDKCRRIMGERFKDLLQ